MITDLRVEGKNKDEVFQKLSVIDLGEHPMSSSNTENRAEKFKQILELTKVVRKFLPSFFGLMLQVCSEYITPEEFKLYNEITKHERLANILKNVKNLHDHLNKFCEVEAIEKPKSLQNKVDTSCLTKKSELVNKFKTPEQVVEFLMSNGNKIVLTEHSQTQGIAFCFKSLTKFYWFEKSLNVKKDGVKVFSKMRTRLLSTDQEGKLAAFLSFDCLREAVIEKIKSYIGVEVENNSDEVDQLDPKQVIVNFFHSELMEYERCKKERFDIAEQFVKKMQVHVKTVSQSVSEIDDKSKECKDCGYVAKSKRGLTQHIRKCKKKNLVELL